MSQFAAVSFSLRSISCWCIVWLLPSEIRRNTALFLDCFCRLHSKILKKYSVLVSLFLIIFKAWYIQIGRILNSACKTFRLGIDFWKHFLFSFCIHPKGLSALFLLVSHHMGLTYTSSVASQNRGTSARCSTDLKINITCIVQLRY